MTSRRPRSEMSAEELADVRHRETQNAYKRAAGQGGLVPNDRVRARLRFLIEDKGVPARSIAAKAGVTETMVLAHYHGVKRNGARYGQPLHKCTWRFEQAVMGARFSAADVFLVPSCGVKRRMDALVHAGYSYQFLADYQGTKLNKFHRKLVTDSRERVRKDFHDQIAAMYEKLIDADPVEQGVTPHGHKYARAIAKKKKFHPAHVWDWDTIDDPEAFPEWTGECGTERGYALHLKYDIAVEHSGPPSRPRRSVRCDPCKNARGVAIMAPISTWDDDTKREIIARYKAGETLVQLAQVYGCSTRTIERFKVAYANG